MKTIERPDWQMICESLHTENDYLREDHVNRWFDTHIEPHNKLIESAVEVYAHNPNKQLTPDNWKSVKYDQDTHRAYLIGIEPIKKDTAEDVLRDIVNKDLTNFKDIWMRAKAVLEES